jgi:hypothetical protein
MIPTLHRILVHRTLGRDTIARYVLTTGVRFSAPVPQTSSGAQASSCLVGTVGLRLGVESSKCGAVWLYTDMYRKVHPAIGV